MNFRLFFYQQCIKHSNIQTFEIDRLAYSILIILSLSVLANVKQSNQISISNLVSFCALVLWWQKIFPENHLPNQY
jgi:hypothetical protein